MFQMVDCVGVCDISHMWFLVGEHNILIKGKVEFNKDFFLKLTRANVLNPVQVHVEIGDWNGYAFHVNLENIIENSVQRLTKKTKSFQSIKE